MNVLVIGAGMLASVYGGHLARAGHEVSFLVRTPRASRPLRLAGRWPRRAFTLDSPRYVTAVAEAPTPEYALVCLPSDPLDLGLVERLAAALPRACTIVSFTPGFRDPDEVLALTGPGRALFAMPGVSAMEEHGEVRFWVTAMVPTRIGPHPHEREAGSFLRTRAERLARALTDAGVPARYDHDTVTINRVTTASFMPMGALMRAYPNDLRAALDDDDLVRLVCASLRETSAAAAVLWGEEHLPRLALSLVHPGSLRALAALVRRIQPAAFRFAEKHFTKINTQNALMMRSLLSLGHACGVAMPAFETLVARFAPASAGPSA